MFVLHNIIQVKVIGAVCTNKHVGLRMYMDDCERTATVALPTAASTELLVDNHSSNAALEAFSPIFEPPLYNVF